MKTFISHGVTDIGRKRKINQDAFLINEQLHLFIVADGMGGHRAGDVASQLAIKTIEDFFSQTEQDNDFTWPFGMNRSLTLGENKLINAIRLANRDICQMAQEDIELAGMGTTIVGVYGDGDHLCIAHAGDSRAYRLRNTQMEQLTIDHSWVSEQLQKNLITEEDARVHRWRNVITRALGNKMDVEVDVKRIRLQDGDLFLLCTDGLSSMIPDTEVREILIRHKSNLDEAANKLIERANFYGGNDNITIVIFQYLGVASHQDTDKIQKIENSDA